MPTTLSVITTSFPEEERPRAIGVWVGIAGGGAIIGLFVTGLLLEWFPWSSFFGLNVAFAVVALIGTLAVVPGSVDENPPALDIVGALLSLVGIAALVFGIIEGPERGWTDPVTLAAIALGVGAGIAFVLWELRLKHPLARSAPVPLTRLQRRQPDHHDAVPGRLRLLLRVPAVPPIRDWPVPARGGHRAPATAIHPAADGPERAE